MGRRLSLGAAALVLLLGVGCGAKTTLPRYVYYPLPTPTTEASEWASGDVAAEAQDDPAPADFVDARPATDGVARTGAPAAPAALNLPRGAIGQIEIPKVHMAQPIYEGTALSVLAGGPGHWTGTPMPGDTGNTVFAGHRVTHTHPFLDLDQLQAGDQVIFTTGAGRFVYSVTRSFVVTPDSSWIANPTPDATVTLYACHPKHQKTHRIVVVGHLTAAQRTAPSPPPPAPAPAPPRGSAPPPAPSAPPAPASTPPASPPDTRPPCWIRCVGR
jgi:sortase A